MNEDRNRFLPVAEPDLGPLEEQYLLDAFRSGWISSIGPYIERFEKAFASFCGVGYGVAVSNGTVAIHLALLAVGVRPGDEVIVPALTFVATASAVKYIGAVPVFVESEPEIGTLDPRAVERAVSLKTKAIIPVHLYGHPADMDPIIEIARRHGLAVIEDAAEAHGAKYKGRMVGSIGSCSTFSFYGNKILTTGEGGMIVTNDKALADRIRFLKDHAMDSNRRYWHPEIGYNYRMTNLQAAIGCAQLDRFNDLLSKRKKVLELYRTAFSKKPEILINPSRPWAVPVPWFVCAILPHGTTHDQRDSLMEKLREKGIDSRPYFHLLCDMPPYAPCRKVGINDNGLPVAEDLSLRGVILPSVTWLSNELITRIASIFQYI
jgi:perosamine synthetase